MGAGDEDRHGQDHSAICRRVEGRQFWICLTFGNRASSWEIAPRLGKSSIYLVVRVVFLGDVGASGVQPAVLHWRAHVQHMHPYVYSEGWSLSNNGWRPATPNPGKRVHPTSTCFGGLRHTPGPSESPNGATTRRSTLCESLARTVRRLFINVYGLTS